MIRAREILLREQCSEETVTCRVAGVERLAHRAEHLTQARRLRCRDAERPHHLLFVEAEEPARRGEALLYFEVLLKGTDINALAPEERAKGEVCYNYGMQPFPEEEAPGISVFYKDESGSVFHTYSAYARGLDYEKRGEKKKAVEMYESALRLFPDNAAAKAALDPSV